MLSKESIESSNCGLSLYVLFRSLKEFPFKICFTYIDPKKYVIIYHIYLIHCDIVELSRYSAAPVALMWR